MDEQRIRETLQVVQHPKLKKSLIDLGMVRNISFADGMVSLDLALKSERSPLKKLLVGQIETTLSLLPEVSSVQVNTMVLSPEEAERMFPKPPLKGIEKVRHFVAVASGKGGVGKTTVAVNLALSLAASGYKTGLLDADIYGPSIPTMMALSDPLDQAGEMILPNEKYGLRIISLGMTAGQDEAFIWRGPLVSKMISQLLGQVKWGELDYLVIDLPPGTGDPSITIAQLIPQASILMVTTPQEVSLTDVRRAISLFRKHNLQIVGLVENMSYFTCEHSSQPIEIFGHGGGEKLSREAGLPLLEKIPLDLNLREGGDTGTPLMASAPDSEVGLVFKKIAEKLVVGIESSAG